MLKVPVGDSPIHTNALVSNLHAHRNVHRDLLMPPVMSGLTPQPYKTKSVPLVHSDTSFSIGGDVWIAAPSTSCFPTSVVPSDPDPSSQTGIAPVESATARGNSNQVTEEAATLSRSIVRSHTFLSSCGGGVVWIP